MNDDELFYVNNDLRITCADAIELVTQYLDDALAASDLQDFATHLAQCEGCQVFLDQTRATVRLVSTHGATEVDVPPASLDALAARLAALRMS